MRPAARPGDAVVVALAPSGKVVFSNREASRVENRELADIAGEFAIFHPDGRPYEPAEWQLARALASGEEVVDEEFVAVGRDGARTRFRCSASPIRDREGSITGAVSVTRDATAEQDRERGLTYLAGLIDHADDAIVACDGDWYVTMWSRGAERMYGWTAEEVLGRHTTEVADLEMSDEERARVRRAVAEHGRWRGETVVRRKDGSTVTVELITVALRDATGAVTAFLGIHRDVSERKRAEKALAEAHLRSETILESIPDEFVAVDRDWRYTYINDRALQRMQVRSGRPVSRDDMLGRTMWDAFPDAVGTEFDRRYQEAMRGRRAVEFESYFAPSDEWIEAHAYPTEGGLSIYSRDISARKRSEEQTQRRQTILDHIADAFYVLDADWRFTYINERAVAVMDENRDTALPREAHLGRTVWEMFPDLVGTELETHYRTAVGELRATAFEYFYATTERWFEVRVYPTDEGLLVYLRDVTERKRADAELERWTHRQALVAALGQRALAGEPVQAVMGEAVAIVARALDAAPVGIAEVLPGGELLLLRAGVGWNAGSVGHATGQSGRASLVGYTALAGGPVISEDLATDERFDISAFLAQHAVTSAATVLIAGHDAPFGVLCAFSEERRVFSADDVNFLQGVANVVSSAVVRVRSEERILEVRDIERRRIARDLHDEALQDLTDALALVVAAGAPAPGSEMLRQVARALKRAGEHVRGAVFDLRLGQVDRDFRALLDDIVRLQGAVWIDGEIVVTVGDSVPRGRLGHEGTEVLRVVREALINARRHSGARNAIVEVRASKTQMWVEVSDDGRGFEAVAEGTGITGMRERAAVMGGELQIRSTPGRGTRVRLTIDRSDGDEPSRRVRVLLIDDHAAVRQAIAAMFEREPDFDVVGQAATMAEARKLLSDVDVAVVDLGLPDGYGGELIKELRAVNPGAQALVLTASMDRIDLARAIESGAAGTLDKSAQLDDVVSGVRRLRAGDSLHSTDEIVDLLRFAGDRRERERDDRHAIERLTARELEVLQALADGLDSQAIADRLHVTIRTERNHIANILAKLNVHSQLQALVFALRYGLVEIR
jgi:PAS domain S-box-containing protein